MFIMWLDFYVDGLCVYKKKIYIYNLGKECESVSVEHIDLLPYTENASRVLSQYFPVLVHIDLHAVHCSVCVECVHTRMRGNPFVDARDNVLGAVFLLVEILVEIIIKSGELERLRKLCGTNSYSD